MFVLMNEDNTVYQAGSKSYVAWLHKISSIDRIKGNPPTTTSVKIQFLGYLGIILHAAIYHPNLFR